MTAKRKEVSSATELRMRAEAQIRHEQGKVEYGQTVSDDLKLLHELIVYKIELEIQNEELRLAQEKAQDTAEKYTFLYDFAPVGYFTIDRNFSIIELNLHGAGMLGKERPKALNSDIRFFMSEDTRTIFTDFLSKTFKTKTKQTCEVKMTKDGNTFINVLLESTGLDHNQSCLLIAVDITGRKMIEEDLRVSESKFKKAFHQNPCLIGLSDIDTGEYLEVNQTFYDVLGFEPNEVIGKRATDLFPFYKNERGAIIDRLRKTGFLHNIETTINKKDGTDVNVLFSAEFFNIGNRDLMFTTGYDITEQKRTTELINQTRQNLEFFFNTIEEFLFVLDMQGSILYVNKFVTDRLGYPMEELIGQQVLMIHPIERREYARQIIGEMLEGKADYCLIPIMTKSGIQIPVETKVVHGVWNGASVLFGAAKDISQIQLSEEKYSKVFHLNPSVCSLSDTDNDQYIEVNDAFTNLFGFSQDEVIGKTPPELGMAFLSTKEQLLSEMDANGRISNVEVKIKARHGELKTVIFNAENIIVNNKVYRYSVATDISERKRIEEKLIHSQERLMALSDASFEALFFSENGLGLDQNQTAERLFGYTHEEIVGKSGTELVIPKDRKKVKHNMLSCRENQYEVTALRKDGTTFPAEIQARMIFYGGRNIRVTALRDISQRKQIEQELVASESRLTQIAANSRVVIWEVDAKGIFTFVSPVAETVFGFRPDEMVNRMYFFDLCPLEGREETTKKAVEVFERKVEFLNLEGVILSKDSGRVWVSMSGMPILNVDGTLKGYRGSSIDITKRKQHELEMSNKMEEIKNYQTKLQKLNYTLINAEETERIRLAGFLHDSLGQILSITRIKLTTLLEDHLLNPKAVKTIKESSKLLSEAIHQSRDETYELNPPILKGFGLIRALNWKLDHLKEHFSINSTLEANTENLQLKDMLNILLFRITGELINNSIKHANATQINLRIMKNDKEIIISVCDDGKGFMYDPGYSFSRNDSFGLFSISERLSAIGGKLIIDSSPGKGTKASVILSV